MKIRASKRWFIFLGVAVTAIAQAATPASTAYLDSTMAVIQSEIDDIHLRVYSS